jgi:hypothetical protein
MPIGFPSVRATSNLNTFIIADSSNSNLYDIALSDKNYTSISALLLDINLAYTTKYPTLGLTFIQGSSGNPQISSLNTTVFPTVINVKQTKLSDMLGFREGVDTMTNQLTIAAATFRLSVDDYLCVYLPQFSSISTNTSSQSPCSFKIPLNTTNGVVYFKENSDVFINVGASHHFNKLDIVIYDKFGFNLNSYGLDYSMSLIFEYY